jgi:hypothetical protein
LNDSVFIFGSGHANPSTQNTLRCVIVAKTPRDWILLNTTSKRQASDKVQANIKNLNVALQQHLDIITTMEF